MGEEKKDQPQKPPPLGRKSGSQSDSPQVPMKGVIAWILVLAMIVISYRLFVSPGEVYKDIPYSPDFIELVKSGKIRKCEIIQEVSGVSFVKGWKKPDESVKDENPRFKVYVTRADEHLQKLLVDNNVAFTVPPQNPFLWQMVTGALPVLLVLGLIYFLFMRQIRSAGHGALSFGKSRARLLNRDKNKVTFANVAGIDEAKEEVEEIIEFLKDPKKFQKLGGRIPKGVMLMGPPGTGKTLLAKAIAGEADVPFFSISGSDFVEMFVGVGASRVRDMFEQGKKNAPCIIFIDEIDAVGRSRFSGIGGGHDEREQTLNALLVEMDGFETQEGVIIVAATNRPDVLDPALLRPGRFDRQIVLDLPMIGGREDILKIHSKGIKLADGVELRRLARGTPGFSGADLENLINEAALWAARQDKQAVEMKDLEEARDKVRWGRERRSRVLDDKEKKITAYHEAGHALVMEVVEDSEPIHKITIIPRGVAYLGATMQLPEKDHYMEGKTKLLGMLTSLMGGRVSEELVLGDITSGAHSDLKAATQLARHMVCDWGMSETLGPQTFGENQELLFLGREINRTQNYSEETAKKIDDEISDLLNKSHNKATEIIKKNRDKLDIIAALLLERETLEGRDVEEIVEHGRLFTDEERDEIDRKKAEASGTGNNGEGLKAEAGDQKSETRKSKPAAFSAGGKEDTAVEMP